MRTSITTFLLLGAILISGCYKEEKHDPLALDPSQVITELRTTPAVLSANNSAQSSITAFLPEDGRQGIDVTFQTDKGVFVENGTTTLIVKTKAATIDDEVRIIATATLRNGLRTGTINVKAVLAGYEVSSTISSVDNPPTGIDIVTPAVVLLNDSTSEMELFAQLSGATGTVSLGHQVSMVAHDPSQNALGTFRVAENSSNADGKCRYVFTMTPNWSYTGPLVFKATSSESTGTFQDSTTVYIIN